MNAHRKLGLHALLVILLAAGPAGAQPAAPPDPPDEDTAEEDEPEEGEELPPIESDAPQPAPSPDPVEEPAPEEEEEDAGEEEEEETLDPARPPRKGMGVVYGTLTDTKLKEPLIEAEVSVVGKKISVITDLDGRYRLELPPGTYDIRFYYELHKATVQQGIVVTADKVLALDEVLEPEEAAVETFEIETEADSSSVEGQLLGRKRAGAVGDSVGRAEIAKTPDKDAAEAAKRVVGVTVVGGRYVFVRGLGERYTNALLDGAPLPSPEPDRQTVPLDLFPAKVLDSLVMVKTFTPEMPGDFAGGSVRIGTRRLPEEFLFSASGSIGFNTQSTFREYLQYKGSSTDWLGVDDGTRQLSDAVPDYRIERGLRRPDGEFITTEELVSYGQNVNAFMSTLRQTAPPNHNFDVVVGNTFDLGGDDRLGVLGAINYGREFILIEGERYRTARSSLEDPTDLVEQNDYTIERGIDEVRWGGLLGLTYEINPRHKLHLTALHSRSSEDEAREVEGFHAERGAIIHETRLEMVSRGLTFVQLRGEHDFPDADEAHFDWNGSIAFATRDQPDTRALVHQFDSGIPAYAFEDDSLSGMHFYNDMTERTIGAGLNWHQPLDLDEETPTSIKLGSLVNLRTREFNSRRFRFRPTPGVDSQLLQCNVESWDPACADQLFDRNNIGPVLTLEESTEPTDSYETDLNVFAGYVMVDTYLVEGLRFIGGPRLEVSRLSLDAFDPIRPDVEHITGDLDSEELLPGGTIIWSMRDDMNLRFAASGTVARPQLLEFAPFGFSNTFGGYRVIGNPELVNTRIWNGDIRYEWFPTLQEVIAASVFAKRFIDPIEQVLKSGSGNSLITYQNAEGANLIGGELEARKGFGFITPALTPLSIIANLTLAFSEVNIDLDTPEAANLTSTTRRMTQQAPWVVNLALDYSNDDSGTRIRLLYNVAGHQIVTVGEKPIPDIYQQPRHVLDATAAQEIVDGLDVKIAAKNILNFEHKYTYGPDDEELTLHRSWRDGISFSLGASYTH